MADATTPLASILAGNDPLAPQILQALHNEQARNYVQDPNNWQGGGLFGGLARIIAGAGVPNNTPLVADIASQRAAARPQQAALLSQPNPFAAIAANPSAYSPLAQSMILNGATPENAALSQLQGANAGLIRGRLATLEDPNMTTPQPGGGSGGGAGSGSAAPQGNPAALGSGRYQPSDPLAAAVGMTPERRMLMLQDPRIRSLILQRYRTASPAQAASGATGQLATGLPPIAARNAP